MGKKEKALDDYISSSADFAQPILLHLRELVHKTCPTVEEKMKWGMPHFDYKNEMMCSMAAFKRHCVFGFWKAALMKDPVLMENARSEVAMGHLGRICTIKDLPPNKRIAGWIREAMELNDKKVRLPSKSKTLVKEELVIPDYFATELARNKAALTAFDHYAYSHKKEYIEWIVSAKTEATRNKRIATSIEWLAEGKRFHWKYASK